MMILVGVEHDDTADDVEWLVKKTLGLRIFDDDAGVMNRSVLDVGGEILVVSQFTLHASTRKGNRPSSRICVSSRPLSFELPRWS